MNLSDDELLRRYHQVKSLSLRGADDAVPVAEGNAELDAVELHRLQMALRGEVSDAEIRSLVAFFWPDVLLDRWQVRLIKRILSGRWTNLNEVGIKGCTKAGKGFAVAISACLWFEGNEECKVVITSQRHKHAHDVMFGEVLRCRKRMRHVDQSFNGDTRIKAHQSRYIVTASPESGEGFSGQHGPATLFLFDEATAITEEYWDQAKTQAAVMVALANPRTMSGWFRNLFPAGNPDQTQVVSIPGGRRYLVTIGGKDCLNVRSGEDRIQNQISRARYEGIMAHPNKRWSRIMGDGKFPDEDEDVLVIAPSWLERHLNAWRADLSVTAFGLDVAASIDGDRTELACGGSGGCRAIHEKRSVDTMQVVGWVLRSASKRYGIDLTKGDNPIAVDMDGLGKGVGDRLAEKGCWVIEIRGNATSQVDPKQYANARAENYGELGLRLNPKGPWPDEPWALPRDQELLDDLCAPEKEYGSDGIRYKITPKNKPNPNYRGVTLAQKLGRSPDKGDACSYLYSAVRELVSVSDWQHDQEAEILASGEDPAEERRPLEADELDGLDAFLRGLLESSREDAGGRHRESRGEDWL